MIYKIYRSGENYEIYSYERGGFNAEDCLGDYSGIYERLENEKKKEDELLPWETLEQVDRTEERRKQTLRDNAMALKRMAREYFSGEVFFVTLTFEDNVRDIDKADRKLKYFIKKLREEYGEVSWIGVRELQKKRNVIHYHLLLKNETILNYFNYNKIKPPIKKGKYYVGCEKQKEYERFIQSKFWKYGFVKWMKINFVDDTGAYLCKYMSKGDIEEMKWLENRRLILKSADIKKITALDYNQNRDLYDLLIKNIKVIESIAKDDIKDKVKGKRVFTNGYNSEFAGKVLYYDIHLKRMEKDDIYGLFS